MKRSELEENRSAAWTTFVFGFILTIAWIVCVMTVGIHCFRPFPIVVLIFGISLLVTGIFWLRHTSTIKRMWMWAKDGKCPGCGYDLFKTQRQCPECGRIRKTKRASA